jgi:hypothetical protein
MVAETAATSTVERTLSTAAGPVAATLLRAVDSAVAVADSAAVAMLVVVLAVALMPVVVLAAAAMPVVDSAAVAIWAAAAVTGNL